MSTKSELSARVVLTKTTKTDFLARTQLLSAPGTDESPAEDGKPKGRVDEIKERLARSIRSSDIHYVRDHNKFRLFVWDPGNVASAGAMRTVTMVIGHHVPNSGWRDDPQGGWLTIRGGAPDHSLEMLLEKYIPSLRLVEITRI